MGRRGILLFLFLFIKPTTTTKTKHQQMRRVWTFTDQQKHQARLFHRVNADRAFKSTFSLSTVEKAVALFPPAWRRHFAVDAVVQMQRPRPLKGRGQCKRCGSPAANPQTRWTSRGTFKLASEVAAASDSCCRPVPPLLWRLNGRKYGRVRCFWPRR